MKNQKLEFQEMEDESIVFKMEKGDKLVLPPEVADEIWEAREKAHARRKILSNRMLFDDDTIEEDILLLGEAYFEEKCTLEDSLCEYIIRASLTRRDFELMQDELEELDDAYE